MEFKAIEHLMNETESLTDLQKSFYKSCIQNRYNKNLVTALRKNESRTEPQHLLYMRQIENSLRHF